MGNINKSNKNKNELTNLTAPPPHSTKADNDDDDSVAPTNNPVATKSSPLSSPLPISACEENTNSNTNNNKSFIKKGKNYAAIAALGEKNKLIEKRQKEYLKELGPLRMDFVSFDDTDNDNHDDDDDDTKNEETQKKGVCSYLEQEVDE